MKNSFENLSIVSYFNLLVMCKSRSVVSILDKSEIVLRTEEPTQQKVQRTITVHKTCVQFMYKMYIKVSLVQ